MADVSVFPEKTYVFVPDPDDMYVPAKVLTTFKRGEKGNVEIVEIQTKASARTENKDKKRTKNMTLTPDQSKNILPMDPESLASMSNMVSLKQLNNGSILHNLRLRFFNDEIYTAIGTILVSVNPFKVLPLYTPKLIDSFIVKGSAKNEPHVYGVADDAYKAMTRFYNNQSCIVAGESGAGKTEATKVFLSYLAEISSRQEGNNQGSIQQQILEANPLMEAFGNAKTLRNDNSSRFGKWIAINFNNKRGQIIGGSITQYLLEKSRVVRLSAGERNYHIFYQMCTTASTDPAFGMEYKLQDPDFYNYLNPDDESHAGTAADSNEVVENSLNMGIDDAAGWLHTCAAMETIGIDEDQKAHILRTVAGILHLGNIKFEGSDSSKVKNPEALKVAADQLGTTPDKLAQALTKKNVSAGKEITYANYTPVQAADARDTLAKAVYTKLFSWLVTRINTTLSTAGTSTQDPKSTSIIGVLDIFGFESFLTNSFEQLCINYCNEKLQGHFNEHIFKLEQAEYAAEGVDVSKIDFVDNGPVLDALERKTNGIFARIDEEVVTPRGTDQTLLSKVLGDLSAVIKKPDVAATRDNKALQMAFVVVHYAGDVAYNVDGFLAKNKDSLLVDLEDIGLESSSEFVRDIFSLTDDAGAAGGSSTRKTGAANKKTIGAQFKDQLAQLMKTLNATEPHFVRCIKPNMEKVGDIFNGQMVMDQLRYSGILEVCRIRQTGYPVRKDFKEFSLRYGPIVTDKSKRGSVQDVTKALVDAKLLTGSDWQLGKSKVFMRTPIFNALEEKREIVLGQMVKKMQKVARGFVARRRYKKLKVVLDGIKAAMQSRTLEKLEAAFLRAGELPHNGRHIKVVKEAKVLLDKLKEEKRVLGLIKAAVAARDPVGIASILQTARDIGLGDHAEVKAAEALRTQIEQERAALASLSAAISAAKIADLDAAIAGASKLPSIAKHEQLANAKTLLARLKLQEQTIADLTKAIAEKKVDAIEKGLNIMVNELGLRDHPLVAEGEKISSLQIKISQERAKETAKCVNALEEACTARDLDRLVELQATVIKLAMTGVVVEKAQKMRVELQAEREALAPLEAELRNVDLKTKSHDGVTKKDIERLTAAIAGAKGKVQASNQVLKDAVELEVRANKMISAQAELKTALASKKAADLEKAAKLAQELGMQNSDAQAVFAEVRALEEARQAAAAAKTGGVQAKEIKEATTKELDKEKVKRDAMAAKSSSSKKHADRIRKARGEIYNLAKYYEIRSDEDFTSNDMFLVKTARAERKLKHQKTAIGKSLLALSPELSKLAIRNFKSILQWCGDMNCQFPTTLAQDVLVRGLELPDLVDEIYCQLCKQCTDNPRPESENQAWLLMCMATKTFPPSENFSLYLLNFLLRHERVPGLIGNYARLCVVQLDATIELGATWYTPPLETIAEYQKRPPTLATVRFVDGHVEDFPLGPEATVESLVQLCSQSQGIKEAIEISKMAIFIEAREMRYFWGGGSDPDAGVPSTSGATRSRAKSIKVNEKGKEGTTIFAPLVAALAVFDNAKSILGNTDEVRAPPAPKTAWPLPNPVFVGDIYARVAKQNREPVLSYKKMLFVENDSKPDKTLYQQLVRDFVSGCLPIVDKEKVVQMVGIAMAESIRPVPTDVRGVAESGLLTLIPQQMYGAFSENGWAEAVLKVLPTLAKDPPAALQMKFIQLCQMSPLYGAVLFSCFRSDNDTDYQIAINKEGINFLTPTYDIQSKILFKDIARFGASPTFLWANCVDPTKKGVGGAPALALVTLFTFQSAEAYSVIYAYTHFKAPAGTGPAERTSVRASVRGALRRLSMKPGQ